MEKRLCRHIWFSSSYYYSKHPIIDKICSLTFSSCLQQHFHNWFYVLTCNSDHSKLEWALLLFNFNYICHLAYRSKFFSIPISEYASFSHQGRVTRYYFKRGTICLILLSSHVFTALEFDSIHFGILLCKIVKPRDHNEIALIGRQYEKQNL